MIWRTYNPIAHIRTFRKRWSFDGAVSLWVSVSPRKFAWSIDIPIRVLKENADIFADYDYVCGFFNEAIKKSEFQSILKNANITPVFKKGYRDSKEDYRLVSILLVISQNFWKITKQTNINFYRAITVQIPMWV